MAILKKFLASAATTINNNTKKNNKNKNKNKVPKSVSFVNDETPVLIITNNNDSDLMRRDNRSHDGRTSVIIEIEKFQSKTDIWFTTSEELEFKQRDQRLCMSLQTLSPQALEQQTGDSPRGLEHGICYETLNSINNRRRRSLNCVFASQSLFKKQGKDGSESIAKSYSLVCEDATKTAIERAKHDEDFVDNNIHKLGSSRSLLSSSSSSTTSSSLSSSSSSNSDGKKKCNPIKKIFNGGKKCPSSS